MALHPSIADMFTKLVKSGRLPLSAGSPGDARALVASSRAALGAGPSLHEVRTFQLPTRSGAIGARIYKPAQSYPALAVYAHGGGWVVGELDDYDAMARTLAARSGCAILVPDYRLAPEHPFPAGLQDIQDAIVWSSDRLAELGGVHGRLLVAGDSAGANLVTVSLHALCNQISIHGQLLIYPVVDCDFERPSYQLYSKGMQLTKEDMLWFFSHYATTAFHSDPRVSPLLQIPHASTPRTVVFTAECDVLRDEGEAYVAHLQLAGINVTLRRMDALPHGFIRLHNLFDVADAALTDIANELARLANDPPATARTRPLATTRTHS
jgi:acetyl esterase